MPILILISRGNPCGCLRVTARAAAIAVANAFDAPHSACTSKFLELLCPSGSRPAAGWERTQHQHFRHRWTVGRSRQPAGSGAIREHGKGRRSPAPRSVTLGVAKVPPAWDDCLNDVRRDDLVLMANLPLLTRYNRFFQSAFSFRHPAHP